MSYNNDTITLNEPSDIHINNYQYMSRHIGDNKKLDNNIEYINEQKSIIEDNNKKIYNMIPHDMTFDTNEQGYNAIQNRHPFGINMLSNHGDRGFDYRDFPNEINRDTQKYDPYIGYLHKKGLIGKNKKQYTTNYVNIDSRHRIKEPSSTIKQTILLDNDPFLFIGDELKIMMSNTYDLKINDKISINGLNEREEIFRTVINDIDNSETNTFEFKDNIQYVCVNAPINMDISSENISDINTIYNDIKIQFSNFKGDTKTEWLFDLKQYTYNIVHIANTDTYRISLTENVNAFSLIDGKYVSTNMIIASFIIDTWGKVLSIADILDPNSNLVWLDETKNNPEAIPIEYITFANSKLIELKLEPPTLPSNFYTIMKYIEDVQNVTRPIFYNYMSTVNNFITIYGTTYIVNLRIVKSEYTVIKEIENYGNITLNELNNYHNMYLSIQYASHVLGISDDDDTINMNKFYFNLELPYEDTKMIIENPLNSNILKVTTFTHTISDVTILYNHYGGVPIRNILADYPIGILRTDGYRYIKNIVENKYIIIKLDRNGLYYNNFGSDSISIGIINNVEENSFNSNSYVIDFGKVYTDIVMIKMIGSSFPKTHKLINDGIRGEKKNNCLYWQNLNDGNTLYKIEINTGIYNANQLKNEIEYRIKLINRKKDNISINSRNYIVVDINEVSNIVTFTAYDEYIPPGISYINNIEAVYEPILSIELITTINEKLIEEIDVNDIWYRYPTGGYFTNFANAESMCSCIRVRIFHKNHKLRIKDKVIIENSTNIGVIPENYINTEHLITQIINNDIYDIVVTNVNIIENIEFKTQPENRGGYNVKIYSSLKFRLRFDFDDTFGDILGFRNIGDSLSITPYKTIITNNIIYENESINTIISSNKLINTLNQTILNINNNIKLNTPEYLIIGCKEIQNVKNNGFIKDYFYKIHLPGNNNEYVYDTYVDNPIFYNQVLHQLRHLSLVFYTPTGELYNFNRCEHSFVLEIICYSENPIGTNIASN